MRHGDSWQLSKRCERFRGYWYYYDRQRAQSRITTRLWLVSAGIILHKLTDGKTKVLAIAVAWKGNARRVDFLYTPPNEYAFAVLYFAGSKVFNTVMRQRALNMGYTLNEHGIYKLVGGKGARVDDEFPNEKSIFDFLKMKYKLEEKRCQSSSDLWGHPSPRPG